MATRTKKVVPKSVVTSQCVLDAAALVRSALSAHARTGTAESARDMAVAAKILADDVEAGSTDKSNMDLVDEIDDKLTWAAAITDLLSNSGLDEDELSDCTRPDAAIAATRLIVDAKQDVGVLWGRLRAHIKQA